MAADATLDGTMQAHAAAATAFEERFRELLTANGSSLARLAASYTRSASDRDDLLQEIAMALWRALPRFRGECSERTFLFRIAHNRCIAYLTRQRPLVALEEEEEIDPRDPQPSAEHRLVQEQQGAMLLAAVRQLPLIYRQVIVLTLEGLSYKEIAQVLGIGEGNVGARLTRARQLLRTLLEDRT
jgi:RNA polymerase sigma factor (sigma-70 family)